MECHFCNRHLPETGAVDIGGLKLCPPCYESRLARTDLPCLVCSKPTPIAGNPLIVAQACQECQNKADLGRAYRDAYRDRKPCDRCGRTHKHHHASVYGQNLCHDCYEVLGHPCTQLYPGDRGLPAFDHPPSVPAVLLPSSNDGFGKTDCVACGQALDDPAALTARFRLPAICGSCDGPKWWSEMYKHRAGVCV